MSNDTENSTGFAWLDNNSLAEPEDRMKDAASATLTADEVLDDIASKPCLCSITVLKNGKAYTARMASTLRFDVQYRGGILQTDITSDDGTATELNEFYRVLSDYGRVLEEADAVESSDTVACILVIIPPSYRNQIAVQITDPVFWGLIADAVGLPAETLRIISPEDGFAIYDTGIDPDAEEESADEQQAETEEADNRDKRADAVREFYGKYQNLRT